jgi:hypothetical protein
MADPVFPTAYQVEVRGTLYGQLVENVWHVQGPDPFDPTVAELIASEFQTDYVGIMADLSQDYSIHEIFVKNFGGVASGEFTLAITPSQVGGAANPGLPGSVAFCVSLRTALAGRTTRGRKFIAGLDETTVTGNTLDAAVADGIVGAINGLKNGLITLGNPLSIFSKTAVTLVPVTAATKVDNFVDSQNRRLTGRGR